MNLLWSEDLKTADIDTATSGDNTIIAAPGAGSYLAIDFLILLPTSAVSVQFKTGSTEIGGAYPLDAKQSIVIDNAIQHTRGIITCGDNEAFVMNLGGAVQVGGMVRYRIVNK